MHRWSRRSAPLSSVFQPNADRNPSTYVDSQTSASLPPKKKNRNLASIDPKQLNPNSQLFGEINRRSGRLKDLATRREHQAATRFDGNLRRDELEQIFHLGKVEAHCEQRNRGRDVLSMRLSSEAS